MKPNFQSTQCLRMKKIQLKNDLKKRAELTC